MSHLFEDVYRRLRSQQILSSCARDEAHKLWRHAKTSAHLHGKSMIVELGTLNGFSATIMASAVAYLNETIKSDEAPDRVYTVDNYSAWKKNKELLQSKEQNQALFENMGYGEQIICIESDDLEFLRALDDQSIGLLFIDSIHIENHVKETLDIAIRKVANNGMISGHDYCWTEPGVVYAVERWRKENAESLHGFGLENTMWWTLLRR